MKAGIYLRQSLDRDGNELGVTRQREDCTALAKSKGWDPVEYVDNDTSASSGKKRPSYERLLADIAAGRIGAVIAWDLDRLHRRPVELEDFMALADEKHVALATVSGDVDLSTAQGRLVARLKGAVARHEVEHKSARQRRAARQKAERGLPQWKRAFGYLDSADGPVPDPSLVPLVRKAYRLLLSGGSLSEIAALFNDSGHYGLNGQPWSASTVSLFLRSPRNAGLRSHNREIVGKASWKPLVPEATWRSAQSVLSQPERRPGPKSVRQHLWTGLLLCGKKGCGGTLSGQWVMQKTGGKSGRPKAGEVKESHPGERSHTIAYGCKKCRGCSVRAEQIHPILMGLMSGRLSMPDAADLLYGEKHDEAETETLREEANGLYERLDGLAVEHADGLLTARQVKVATERIQSKLDAIEKRLQAPVAVAVLDDIRLGTPAAAKDVEKLSPDRLRAVFSLLLRVTVLPVGKGGKVFRPERVKVEWL
jgi:DNA invertase Pin-like site-specific DNA recombinase